MRKRFDFEQVRDTLQRFTINFELSQSKAEYAGKGTLGNAACGSLATVLNGWVVGMEDEVQPVLELSLNWLTEAIQTNEQFGACPEYSLSEFSRCAAIASWLLGKPDDVTFHSSQAMEWYTMALESTWNDDSEKPGGPGTPATPAQRRDTIEDYLNDCIQAKRFSDGATAFEKIFPAAGNRPKRVPWLAIYAYRFCKSAHENQADFSKLKEEGSKYLDKNLFEKWLSSGQQLPASRWLKVIHCDTQADSFPITAFEKARAILSK